LVAALTNKPFHTRQADAVHLGILLRFRSSGRAVLDLPWLTLRVLFKHVIHLPLDLIHTIIPRICISPGIQVGAQRHVGTADGAVIGYSLGAEGGVMTASGQLIADQLRALDPGPSDWSATSCHCLHSSALSGHRLSHPRLLLPWIPGVHRRSCQRTSDASVMPDGVSRP
jgi:hypothetical protein